jgi:hypothetical protein
MAEALQQWKKMSGEQAANEDLKGNLLSYVLKASIYIFSVLFVRNVLEPKLRINQYI